MMLLRQVLAERRMRPGARMPLSTDGIVAAFKECRGCWEMFSSLEYVKSCEAVWTQQRTGFSTVTRVKWMIIPFGRIEVDEVYRKKKGEKGYVMKRLSCFSHCGGEAAAASESHYFTSFE
jgi:hypothetical protein